MPHFPDARRLRVFAGPNGSGKTTLMEAIKEIVPLYAVINPDTIEARLSALTFSTIPAPPPDWLRK